METPMSQQSDLNYREFVKQIAEEIADLVLKKDEEYGASWKKHGGQGAFFAAWRKMDRLEVQMKRHGYDVFAALRDSTSSEDLRDTVKDAIGYMLLWLSENRAHS